MEARSILFVGNFYSPEMLKSIKEDSRGSVSFATHNYEMSLMRGFLSHHNLDISAITVPTIYSYPRYHKDWYIKGEKYQIERASIKSVGFINLPVLKDIWRSVGLFFSLIQFFRKRKNDEIKVFLSCPYSYLLTPLFAVKKILCRRIEVTLLIMDIPSIVSEMDDNKGLKKWVLSLINRSSMKKVAKCNHLVLMTEAMMDFVSAEVSHIIVEGIVDVATMSKDYNPLSKCGKEIILYTGTLREIFGVKNLVDAFELANLDNAELWICGSGDSQEYIEKKAAQNSAIKFFGLVDSKKALELQTAATILVNPRTSEGKYTKYSFPSKTMEYLLAGKSVVINRLPGIPEEYLKYVFTPENESVEALASLIKQVVDMPFSMRIKKAQLGREFIISQKNSHIQTSRIIQLMEL